MVIAKDNTRDSYLERLNRALGYIQENLSGPLTLERVAAEACFSPYHFHRIFRAFVGEGPGEYMQRLRLERAAHKLVNGSEEITRIALDVGYETPAAMARAFRKRFNCSPGEFRKRKAAPPSSPQLPAYDKEDQEMKPDYRTIDDIKVISARKTGAYRDASQEAWSAVCSFAYSNRLVNKESRMIGISYDDPSVTEENKLRYEACITVDRPVSPKGEIASRIIPGGTYAVFLHKGPYEKLTESYRAIFGGWLPGSGEKLRDLPCFEVYHNRDPKRTKPENLRTEIFVPLER